MSLSQNYDDFPVLITRSGISSASLKCMTNDPYRAIEELGLKLPTPTSPKGSYVPMRLQGNIAYLSGALPIDPEGALYAPGVVGNTVSESDAAKAAQLCALNLIARLHSDLGSLTKVKNWIKLTGFVASTATFTQQPLVINGASDFIVQVFGETGRHARSAVGVSSLPLGSSVEVEAIVEVDL